MNLCKFQKWKILLTPFSDKVERGTNPTYKYFTHLREASNIRYFSHEIPHVQTHFSLSLSFVFHFFERQIIAALSRETKKTHTQQGWANNKRMEIDLKIRTKEIGKKTFVIFSTISWSNFLTETIVMLFN